ncbi:MAG: GspE/PulE family protein [bacterium]|nr:GspE/PulE family protein [bacterium]
MPITIDQWKNILVEPGFITDVQYAEITLAVQKNSDLDIGEFITNKGWLTDAQLGKLIAEFYGYRFVNLSQHTISKEALSVIPEFVAKKRQVIAYEMTDASIKIAMADPTDMEIVRMVEKKTGLHADLFFASKVDIEMATGSYESSIGESIKSVLANPDALLENEDLIVEIVDEIISYAYHNKASDIHVEPFDDEVVIRLRVDGILHDIVRMNKNVLELLTTRIKILAKLRTDEHRSAQDGKLQFEVDGDTTIDIRVSILPSTSGEKTVMRILSDVARSYTLENLGMGEEHMEIVRDAIANPHGMILSTGPTGCGKTTSLYAILKILNRREVNISTVEDPVEYDIEGVTQVQVNTKTNLTFADGLRSLLRQDPDIMMVGEIRDEETAGIAVNSALTGHLVLSTLHTNDAATAIPRLIDMGVEPFLVASTVRIIIAQRLLRKICSSCIRSGPPLQETIDFINHQPKLLETLKKAGIEDPATMSAFYGAGCNNCVNTGYRGRVGVFEILEMTDEIRSLVVERADSSKIMNAARRNGMSTMLDDGVQKALNGSTTLKEVLRVTQ